MLALTDEEDGLFGKSGYVTTKQRASPNSFEPESLDKKTTCPL